MCLGGKKECCILVHLEHPFFFPHEERNISRHVENQGRYLAIVLISQTNLFLKKRKFYIDDLNPVYFGQKVVTHLSHFQDKYRERCLQFVPGTRFYEVRLDHCIASLVCRVVVGAGVLGNLVQPLLVSGTSFRKQGHVVLQWRSSPLHTTLAPARIFQL